MRRGRLTEGIRARLLFRGALPSTSRDRRGVRWTLERHIAKWRVLNDRLLVGTKDTMWG
jgi:hypothetical protein